MVEGHVLVRAWRFKSSHPHLFDRVRRDDSLALVTLCPRTPAKLSAARWPGRRAQSLRKTGYRRRIDVSLAGDADESSSGCRVTSGHENRSLDSVGRTA